MVGGFIVDKEARHEFRRACEVASHARRGRIHFCLEEKWMKPQAYFYIMKPLFIDGV